MDIKPNIQKMENGVLSRGSAVCFNNIPTKHEAEVAEAEAQTEADHQNITHPFSADELKATVKIENCTEATVTPLMKTELVEFHNTASTENPHQKDTIKVVSEKMMNTETNIVGADVDRSYTCEEVNDDPYNNLDQKIVSNSDSDPEYDPFADVNCDPIFSQTPHIHVSSASVTNSGLNNLPKSDIRESLTLPSLPKSNLSTARILKHNFRRKTPHLDYTLQCNSSASVTHSVSINSLKTGGTALCEGLNQSSFPNSNLLTARISKPNVQRKTPHLDNAWQCHLCLLIQCSEKELKTHMETCAASHRHGNRFCVLCNKVFSTAKWCQSHVLIMHKNALQCQLCLQRFNSESQLRTHIEICAAAASYKNSRRFCVACNKLFASADTLKIHAFNIHGIVRVPCKYYVKKCY